MLTCIGCLFPLLGVEAVSPVQPAIIIIYSFLLAFSFSFFLFFFFLFLKCEFRFDAFLLTVALLSLFSPRYFLNPQKKFILYSLHAAHPPSLPPLSVSTLFVCINAINNTCILFRDLRNGHFFFFYCQSPSHRHTHTHTHGPFTWRKKRKRKERKH